MFIGINSSTRRRVLREALLVQRALIMDQHSMPSPTERESLDEIDSILREINAAESLVGKPVTHVTHPGVR